MPNRTILRRFYGIQCVYQASPYVTDSVNAHAHALFLRPLSARAHPLPALLCNGHGRVALFASRRNNVLNTPCMYAMMSVRAQLPVHTKGSAYSCTVLVVNYTKITGPHCETSRVPTANRDVCYDVSTKTFFPQNRN